MLRPSQLIWQNMFPSWPAPVLPQATEASPFERLDEPFRALHFARQFTPSSGKCAAWRISHCLRIPTLLPMSCSPLSAENVAI